MRLPAFTILAVITALLFSTTLLGAEYEHLLKKPYAQRYQALDTLFYSSKFWKLDSTTAFKQTKQLRASAKQANDKELVIEVDFIEASYLLKSGRWLDEAYNATLINILKQAEQHRILQLQIRLHYVLSVQHLSADKYSNAFEHQIKYYELLKGVSPEEFPWKKICIAHIGGLYYSFDDYETARMYLEEALRLKGSYKVDDDINIINTLGLIDRKTGRYDSAHFYFYKALALANAKGNAEWKDVILGNIGITFYHEKKYSQAKPLLELDIYSAFARNAGESAINSIVKLADIHRLQGNHDSATYYANVARSLVIDVWHPYKHLVILYKLYNQLHTQSGNIPQALKYADSIVLAKDSLTNRTKILLLAEAQQRVGEQKHKAEVAEKETSISIRNSLIVILLLCMIIGLLLLNRQTIKRKRLEAEKTLADSRFENAQQRLSTFTQALHDKNTLIDSFTVEIERLQSLSSTNLLPDNSRENLLKLQRSTILTDEQWNDFRDIFEKVHGGFLQRLKDKIPGLTPAETRIVVLTKLKMDNKEMANILGIDTGTVRYHKHNLRKKIDIIEGDGLDEVINSI